MQEDNVKKLIEVSGFSRQVLPFTYLGIPICPKKISSKECRITLINSVLITIQAYWSQMMVLPKKVIKAIEAIYRAFLWKGLAMFHGAGAVAWENICQPKRAGGLGIKKLEEWNKACCHWFPGRKIHHSNREITIWLNWNDVSTSLPQLLRWIGRAKISKFHKMIFVAAIAGLVFRAFGG
uniref:Uncharacterized protein n=1 Tax=Cannabis sativa TaxID=3483 RepID=A0A803Q636_CANSA